MQLTKAFGMNRCDMLVELQIRRHWNKATEPDGFKVLSPTNRDGPIPVSLLGVFLEPIHRNSPTHIQLEPACRYKHSNVEDDVGISDRLDTAVCHQSMHAR
jgi:hypothetical protein